MDSDAHAPKGVEGFLTYRFVRVQHKLNAQAGRILKRVAGISLSEWRVLALIGDRDGTSNSEIIARSTMDKGLVSRTLQALQKAGLVQSRTASEDERVHVHSLTDEGRRLFERTLPQMERRQRLIRSAFTREELAALDSALARLEALADIEAFEP